MNQHLREMFLQYSEKVHFSVFYNHRCERLVDHTLRVKTKYCTVDFEDLAVLEKLVVNYIFKTL